MHHFLLTHILYAFVGSVISLADVVGNLRAQPGIRLLAQGFCFPQDEDQGFVEQVLS